MRSITSAELHDARGDDEEQRKELGVREDILHPRRPLDIHRIDHSQDGCTHKNIQHT